MRVAVRGADSSEVVRVSEVSPETSFRELDDAFLQTQTRIWLGEVLHMRFDEETPVAELLADGELLYQVSKVVWKMLLNMHADLKDSKLFINQRTSYSKSNGKKYLPYCRVDSFLKICQILGLTGIDLFSPSDAVGKRDIRRVCMCIRSFSKKARSRNLNVPDFEMVIYTIAMPTDIVGGIRRTLEQSSCSSTNSDSCSDLAKSSKQVMFLSDLESVEVIDANTSSCSSQGQGSKCPDMNAVDQVIFLNHKRFSAPDPELFPDNASAMLSDGKLQSSDDIVSALAICSYETDDVNVSSVSDDSFDKDIKKGTQKESDIGCFLVVSTLETNECTLPGESVGASQTTISKGQDSRMFDGSYPKDTSTCGQSVAEKGQLIGMIKMQEKRDLFSRVPDGALAVSSEENGKIGSHLIHKTDPNLTDASVELKSQNNLDTESNQYDMAELDNTTSYDDTAGLKFSDGTAREKTLKCLIECGNTLDSFVECSSYSPELITTDVHSMFLLNVDGSCRSTCSEESSEQVLPLEEQNAEHSHASHTQPESSQGMMNDFGESGYISEQHPCKRIKNSRIGSDGAKLTKNPKLHCHDHTFAPQELNDDRIRGNPILPCSNSEILEEKNDISTEKFSEVKNQVHLINEAVTITDHAAPNDTDERLKGIEVLEENAPTTPSEKSKVRSTRRKMITSIASSVTVIGALLVFLLMRGKKYIEQNPQTVVPQPAKRTSEKVYTQNKMENTGKPGRMYPGERFKF